MTLEEPNAATDDADLRVAVAACCRAQSWVERVIAGRPYRDVTALHAASHEATAALDDAGLGQALAGHPRIGERHGGGGSGSASASAWSQQEQSGVAGAGDDVRTRLAAANVAYEERFGHVYLVCATGRSAEQMLALCLERLGNDADAERRVVLDELAKINDIRLDKLLSGEGRS